VELSGAVLSYQQPVSGFVVYVPNGKPYFTASFVKETGLSIKLLKTHLLFAYDAPVSLRIDFTPFSLVFC
jgi:hypothetical protein